MYREMFRVCSSSLTVSSKLFEIYFVQFSELVTNSQQLYQRCLTGINMFLCYRIYNTRKQLNCPEHNPFLPRFLYIHMW